MKTPLPGLLLAVLAAACGGDSPSAPQPPIAGNEPGVRVANEPWGHVAEGSPVSYANNPPASGPHYPVWARYREHAAVVPRPYWVHNLEHGAVVLLYRPDAPATVIAALQDVFRSLPPDPQCGTRRSLLTADPLLPRPVAAVAADRVLLADTVDPQVFRDFNTAHRDRAPERVCADGTYP